MLIFFVLLVAGILLYASLNSYNSSTTSKTIKSPSNFRTCSNSSSESCLSCTYYSISVNPELTEDFVCIFECNKYNCKIPYRSSRNICDSYVRVSDCQNVVADRGVFEAFCEVSKQR